MAVKACLSSAELAATLRTELPAGLLCIAARTTLTAGLGGVNVLGHAETQPN